MNSQVAIGELQLWQNLQVQILQEANFFFDKNEQLFERKFEWNTPYFF